MIPNKEQALELLKKYNSDPFHIKHGLIVSGVMEYFANELATPTRPISGALSVCCTILTSSCTPSSTA